MIGPVPGSWLIAWLLLLLAKPGGNFGVSSAGKLRAELARWQPQSLLNVDSLAANGKFISRLLPRLRPRFAPTGPLNPRAGCVRLAIEMGRKPLEFVTKTGESNAADFPMSGWASCFLAAVLELFLREIAWSLARCL
jgi:hypothetical protein